MTWGVAEAKAKLSSVLDKAASEGPQVIRRRKQEFFLLTKEQLEARTQAKLEERKPFVSAWDALRPSFANRYDVDFPRMGGTVRDVNFD